MVGNNASVDVVISVFRKTQVNGGPFQRRLLLPEVSLNNLNNNSIISSLSSLLETIKEEEWIWIECV